MTLMRSLRLVITLVYPALDTHSQVRDRRHVSGLAWTLDRSGFDRATSHSLRKPTATILDDAGLSARLIADQLGHARPSMTQDVYMGRKAVDSRAVGALEMGDLYKECAVVREVNPQPADSDYSVVDSYR